MSTIVKISAHHIKGINDIQIPCEIRSNVPNFLVAPNGSGKSSLTIGFDSLNRDRLKIDDVNAFRGCEDPNPSLEITFDDNVTLKANALQNEIGKALDVAVINSGLFAKHVLRNAGGRSYSEASITIHDSVICKVPDRSSFNYQVTSVRAEYPKEFSSLMTNLSSYFKDPLFCRDLIADGACFKDTTGTRYKRNIELFFEQLIQIGRPKDIRTAVVDYTEIEKVAPVASLVEFLRARLSESNNTVLYLDAIQLNRFCCKNAKEFKQHANYIAFVRQREDLDRFLDCVNTTGQEVKTHISKGQLTLQYPTRSDVSNGELDILKFVTALFSARLKFKADKCLLVIDEVFDYLDDGNLIVAQHFILDLIESFKTQGRIIFPVIMTHMDPSLMKSYRFDTKSVSYFGKPSVGTISSYMKQILRDRDNCQVNSPDIYGAISQYYLHYSHEDYSSERVSKYLKKRNVPVSNLSSNGFAELMEEGLSKYLSGNSYDAAKVCCALRRRVEKFAYEKLQDERLKSEYAQIDKGTLPRFEFVKTHGVAIPEIMILLSSLYNSCMHLKGHSAEEPLTFRKLDNAFIKGMIKEVVKLTNI